MTRTLHHQPWIHRILGKYAHTRAIPQSSPRAFRLPVLPRLGLGLNFTLPIALHHAITSVSTLKHNTSQHFPSIHQITNQYLHTHRTAIRNLLTAFTQSLRFTSATTLHNQHNTALHRRSLHVSTRHNTTPHLHSTLIKPTTATTANLALSRQHRQTTIHTATSNNQFIQHTALPQLITLLQRNASQLTQRTTLQLATLFSRAATNTTLHLASSHSSHSSHSSQSAQTTLATQSTQSTQSTETHTYALASVAQQQSQLRIQQESILRHAEHTATEIIRKEFQSLESTRQAVTTLTRDDYGEIANRVETLLTRRLLIERERRGVHA